MTYDAWLAGSDIHPANIMIRDESHFQSLTTLSSDRIVLIDLGESRTLETLPMSANTYGDNDFRAPEVSSGCQMGKESDMYSIGRVMFKMLEKGLKEASDRRVPKPLLDVTNGCLRRDPKRRLTAEALSARIAKITSDALVLEKSGYGKMRFAETEFVKLKAIDDEEEEDHEHD
jgi:serine/threonine protein kinase